jgi:hypothetical protein
MNGKLGLPPSSGALIRTKTIVGVHVLTGYGTIDSHMTTLVPIKQEMVRKQQVIQKRPFT